MTLKPASVSIIKKELQLLPPDRLRELIQTLCKFKTENKELISYLLFDSEDLATYLSDCKQEINEVLEETLEGSPHLIKRGLRKIQRRISRVARYTGTKEAEVELLTYFSQRMHEAKLHRCGRRPVELLYDKQVEKITKLMPKVHEDLQADYNKLLSLLKKW